jgi:hypothetical protein
MKLAPFSGKVFKPNDDSRLHFPASQKRWDFSDGTVTQYHSTQCIRRVLGEYEEFKSMGLESRKPVLTDVLEPITKQ